MVVRDRFVVADTSAIFSSCALGVSISLPSRLGRALCLSARPASCRCRVLSRGGCSVEQPPVASAGERPKQATWRDRLAHRPRIPGEAWRHRNPVAGRQRWAALPCARGSRVRTRWPRAGRAGRSWPCSASCLGSAPALYVSQAAALVAPAGVPPEEPQIASKTERASGRISEPVGHAMMRRGGPSQAWHCSHPPTCPSVGGPRRALPGCGGHRPYARVQVGVSAAARGVSRIPRAQGKAGRAPMRSSDGRGRQSSGKR